MEGCVRNIQFIIHNCAATRGNGRLAFDIGHLKIQSSVQSRKYLVQYNFLYFDKMSHIRLELCTLCSSWTMFDTGYPNICTYIQKKVPVLENGTSVPFEKQNMNERQTERERNNPFVGSSSIYAMFRGQEEA